MHKHNRGLFVSLQVLENLRKCDAINSNTAGSTQDVPHDDNMHGDGMHGEEEEEVVFW